MSEELVQALEKEADKAANEIAVAWRNEAMREMTGNATQLREYTSEVRLADDGETYEWSVDHPTAQQYELGGTIFHTYEDAKAIGWTRDQFYETLEDCQEIIERQRYAMRSLQKVRGDYRG
jgi:hypothetical protein